MQHASRSTRVFLCLKVKQCFTKHNQCFTIRQSLKNSDGQPGIDQQPTSALTTQRPQISSQANLDHWQPPPHAVER